MTAHTPGPWTAIDNLVVVTEDTHGYSTWLANLAVGGNSRIEQYSNARLMAAAPELLKALLAIVESSDSDAASGGEMYWAEIVSPFVEDAKKLLAKQGAA
jgi:hypothetical protein